VEIEEAGWRVEKREREGVAFEGRGKERVLIVIFFFEGALHVFTFSFLFFLNLSLSLARRGENGEKLRTFSRSSIWFLAEVSCLGIAKENAARQGGARGVEREWVSDGSEEKKNACKRRPRRHL